MKGCSSLNFPDANGCEFTSPRIAVDESLIAYLKNKLKNSPPFKGGVPQSGGVVKINNLPHLKTFRKKLRNNLTPAEAKLWTYLQKSQLDGRKFRRQHSVANYILDFYCPSEKLAIELDGEVHNNTRQAEYDQERDLFLQATGIKVLRFENKVVFENPQYLLNAVKNEFKTTPASGHPSFSGGELADKELDDKLHQLLSYDDIQPFDDEATKKAILKAIDECKILDPACGSGAFPMGVLQKMVHIIHKLDPQNERWKERQIEKAHVIEDSNIRDSLIDDIEEAFENNELDFGRKLYLIENCIYGVDIQPIAVQISKLRFFISLIVEQKVNKRKKNHGVRPLPNLETKFVAANTLIGLDEQGNLFDSEDIKQLEDKLKDVRHRLFSAKTPKTKRKLRDEDKELREQIAQKLEESGWGNETARQLADWDPYDQNASSPFFDPEWMFDVTTPNPSLQGGEQDGGFDVVIGNPPYKQIPKGVFSTISFPYSEGKDKGKQNLYKVFVEASRNLSRKNTGTATMIVQSSLLCDLSSTHTRELLLKHTIIKEIIEFPKVAPTREGQVFENVLQGTCIYRIANAKPKASSKFKISVNNDVTTLSNLDFEYIAQDSLFDLYPDTYYIPLIHNGGFKPINLAREQARPLLSYLVDISQGDLNLTSSKKYFSTIDTGVKLYRGKNIQRYYLINEVEEFVRQEFKSDKVDYNSKKQFLVCQEITGTTDRYRLHFCLTPLKGYYLFGHTANKLTVKDNKNLKPLAVVLNSKFLDWLFRKTSTNNHVMGYEIAQFLIPKGLYKTIEVLTFIYESIHTQKLKSNGCSSLFEEIANALVFNLYFPDHMKERGIDVLQFVEQDMNEVLNPSAFGISPSQGEKFVDFERLSDEQKEFVINQLHKRWSDPKNKVVKRMAMFKEKSPDILKPILES